jgi:hypothetical protein
MRSDTQTVYAQLGYDLRTTQTATTIQVNMSKLLPTETQHLGWRFYIVYKDNSTEELTSGTCVGEVTRGVVGSGLQSIVYNSPNKTLALMHMTVALRADLYIWFTSDTPTLEATFITNSFQARKIYGNWTIYTYTQRTANATYQTASFAWGSTANNSRISGFKYDSPYSWEAMYENVGNKDLVGFFLVPGSYYFGPLFYALIFAVGGFMLYMRTKSFSVILIFLILLGGVGGALLKPLIPAIGFEWGWALVMIGFAGLLYKLIHGASNA